MTPETLALLTLLADGPANLRSFEPAWAVPACYFDALIDRIRDGSGRYRLTGRGREALAQDLRAKRAAAKQEAAALRNERHREKAQAEAPKSWKPNANVGTHGPAWPPERIARLEQLVADGVTFAAI